MSKINTVFFDLYGTLIHLTQETKPYARLFEDLCLQTPDEFKQARKIALTEDFENLAELVKKIKPDVTINAIPLQSYEKEVASEVADARAYPETEEVLKELRKRNLKLCLISNLASPYKKPFFALGLNTFFDKVFFSCDVGFTKPDIRIYQKALQAFCAEHFQALMVGDKIHCDVDPPKAMGMNALLVERSNTFIANERINTLMQVLEYVE